MIRWKTNATDAGLSMPPVNVTADGEGGPVEADLQVCGALLRPQPVGERIAGDEQEGVVGEDAGANRDERPVGCGKVEQRQAHCRTSDEADRGDPAEPDQPAEALVELTLDRNQDAIPGDVVHARLHRRRGAGHPGDCPGGGCPRPPGRTVACGRLRPRGGRAE